MNTTHHLLTDGKDLTLSFYTVLRCQEWLLEAPLENLLLPSEEAGFCHQCLSTAVKKHVEGLTLESELLNVGV